MRLSMVACGFAALALAAVVPTSAVGIRNDEAAGLKSLLVPTIGLNRVTTPSASSNRLAQALRPRVAAAYGKLPLSFEMNEGQTDSRVKFMSRGSGYSLFLTGGEAVLALHKNSPVSKTASAQKGHHITELQRVSLRAEQRSQETAIARMKLVGANPKVNVTGLDELLGKSNYFIGNNPNKWRTDIPNYCEVRYANIYPGVDLVYYGNQRLLEYDFVVRPGRLTSNSTRSRREGGWAT
jgi:hypothetical protein